MNAPLHPRPADQGAPRVAVIGAGPSGLAALKNLLAAGIREPVCYEASDALGGNWVFRDGPGHSSVYETTHIISSRRLSSFDDFPMPAEYPDYPSHRQILAYFESYADAFGLRPHIVFNARAEAVRRGDDGWWLTVRQGASTASDRFDAVLVCTGHHATPFTPVLPGSRSGEVLHAHDYKRAEPFRGKRVLVVGGGNSAADIAVETARVSARTALSLRHGTYIVPKVLFGLPADRALDHLRRLPKWMRQRIGDLLVRLTVGNMKRYGLPPRPGRLGETHPTVNSQILDALRHGMIAPRPGIESVSGNRVRFGDGREEEFDAIIFATGYRSVFPFLDEPFAAWEKAAPPPLYLKMIPAGLDGLFFIGLFQPIGCIWTLADYQARLAAAIITRRIALPADLEARIDREVANRHFRFEASPRHAVEVDAHEFRRELFAALGLRLTPPGTPPRVVFQR